jgi:hypothetical protein
MADPQQQAVQGPDGNTYQFPSGTTKDQAIAYFKKKGIGTSDYKSVLSEAGKHPKTAKALEMIPAITATGMGIAGAETGPGAVGMAAVGGAAGKALESTLEEKLGFKEKQTSATAEAAQLTTEAAKQGAYELGGRAIGAAGGKAISAIRGIKPEVVGETIGGVKFPETLGQSSGQKGGFGQTIEHYLSKTFLGKPLQEVKAAQQASTRELLANLSHANEAVPGAMAQNWEKATQQTRIMGDTMYRQIGETETATVSPVAKKILGDESLRLPGKARDALTAAVGSSSPELRKAQILADQTARNYGYKGWDEIVSREPQLAENFKRYLPKDVVELLEKSGGKSSVADAIAARSELRDLATNATDRNLGRLYHNAWEQLDKAIDAGLTPEQRAVKAEADKLWRRSYIQEAITKKLQAWQNSAAPSAAPMVNTDAFVKMVNQLAHEPLVREGGQVVAKPSKMTMLFDNPSDRKAMIDLADFLKTKYSTMGGQAGISESIARIGVALEGLRIPGQVVTRQLKAATHGGMSLAALSAMAKVMADPGGVRMLQTYFKSSGAAATALATRIAALALESPMPKQPVAHQSY